MKLTIRSSHTPTECYLRLCATTDASAADFPFRYGDFFGTVTKDHFDVCYWNIPQRHKRYLLMVNVCGKFLETEHGTDIMLRIRPRFVIKPLLLALPMYLLFFAALFVAFYQTFEQSGTVWGMFFAFISIALFVLSYVLPARGAFKTIKKIFQ